MTGRDVNWFSSFYGWRRDDIAHDADTGRTHDLARRAASRDDDGPSPRMKRVWRSMLGNGDAHPPAGDR